MESQEGFNTCAKRLEVYEFVHITGSENLSEGALNCVMTVFFTFSVILYLNCTVLKYTYNLYPGLEK